MKKLPTYFISHGGGPWPYMNDVLPMYEKLAKSLRNMHVEIGTEKPRAVLVISGHWEEAQFTLMSAALPTMLYDYYGFPAHTYQIKYQSVGAPELAKQIQKLLGAKGVAAKLDDQRGYDHGTFVPLAVMYPQADIPVLQLSMKKGYSPKEHYELGKILDPLRNEGVLIVGSGLSYHNLREFGPAARLPSAQFDAWLSETLLSNDGQQRAQKLFLWEQAPSARQAHPQEDHLVPLFVAAGAAENEKVARVYHEDNFFGGITVSSFRFGS